MKNFVTLEDFLPEIKSTRVLTVSTDYNRPDTLTPFVNSIVLNRLVREGTVKSQKVGVGKFKVELVK